MVSAGKITPALASDDAELATLHSAKSFLEKEFGCTIEFMKAANSGHPKAGQAVPGKPAILVE
jgi:hypothetical protein